MFKKIKSVILSFLLVIVLLLPAFVLATSPSDRLEGVGDGSGFNTDPKETALPVIVGDIVSSILTLLGIVFLALIIYAGILYMIAAGNEDKVTRSKDTMRRATIGLVIVVAAYAISQFVVYSLL